MANQAVEVDKAVIGRATTQAVADGIGIHLPGAIGLLLKGPLICAFMAFGHFVLGTDVSISVIVGGLCGLAGVNVPAILRWLDGRRDDPD